MKESEKKQKIVKELSGLHKKLNVERIYRYSGAPDTKSLLARLAAILKNLDESDFRRFENLRQHLYPSIPRPTRKHAAEQIDAFIGQKVEEFKRYDFTYTSFAH